MRTACLAVPCSTNCMRLVMIALAQQRCMRMTAGRAHAWPGQAACALVSAGGGAQDEAFQLWTGEWAALYPKDSKSYQVRQAPCRCHPGLFAMAGSPSIPFLAHTKPALGWLTMAADAMSGHAQGIPYYWGGGLQVLTDLAASWYLVSVVDNDFVNGDIFKVFPQ